MNEYYYSAVKSKKLQEHLTTEKKKTNNSVTQDKNRSQTVKDQTSGWRAVCWAVVWRQSGNWVLDNKGRILQLFIDCSNQQGV